LVWLL